MSELKIKKLQFDAILPEYKDGKENSGFDIYSIEEYRINAFTPILIKTGLSFEIEPGYEIQIRSRSGWSIKQGIIVLNQPDGTIDSGYRGELLIALIKLTKGSFIIEKHSRVAQGVVCKVEHPKIVEVDQLSETIRGEGGFGHTGFGK